EWSLGGAFGGKRDLGDGWRAGGLVNFFYSRDVSGFDDGINDRRERLLPGLPFQPEVIQGDEEVGVGPGSDISTALFDIRENSEQLQWGGLATAGIENELNRLTLTGIFTRTVESTARVAINTRGKEEFYPGYDPTDPDDPGNDGLDNLSTSPYSRVDTLEFQERDIYSLQLAGEHTLPVQETTLDSGWTFQRPTVDWTASYNRATLDEPDRRSFSAEWLPLFQGPSAPGVWQPLPPAALITLPNLSRRFRSTDEESLQGALNASIPFERSGGLAGALSTGLFVDRLDRSFNQDSYVTESQPSPVGGLNFDEPFSALFPSLGTPIVDGSIGASGETPFDIDVDYDGNIDITAGYVMVDLPVSDPLTVVFGARVVETEIGVFLEPENDAFFFQAQPDESGAVGQVPFDESNSVASSNEFNILPSASFTYEIDPSWTLRGAFSQTVARQTFQEISPILQQEFVGGPIFIGNADLGQAEISNYDLRVDFEPYQGGLVSVSVFYKDITDPIEYIQRNAGFAFTVPVNFPEGELFGTEFEVRQDLAKASKRLEGFKTGGSLTILNGQVTIPDADQAQSAQLPVGVVRSTRDLTQTPEYLLNVFLTFDYARTGTQASLFYTVKGDTLVAGASTQSSFIPDIYEREFDTLNFTLSQRLADGVQLSFAAKNLTNPLIQEVYRSPEIGGDVLRSSFTRGIDFSLGLSFTF
ncbi:MAG: TonB-dependent receptor, partial [Planctomycetota bacterium]